MSVRGEAASGAALVPRADFPLLAGDPDLVYLDSAATSQKPMVVLDAIREYYTTSNANPHRGAYRLSGAATEAYHSSRERVARFLGVADADTLIFTRGTTESLNLLATAWGRANVKAGDRIVVTRMEHHANFVPWQQLALSVGAEFKIAELAADGSLDMAQLAKLVTSNTKVVAFAHVSNALGTVNDVKGIVAIAKKVGALAVCDGAQAVPHLSVGIDALGVDAYAFSGHKMLGPMGIGGVVVRRELLEAMPPYQMGGDMISRVGDDRTTWNVLPHKFEAGTPNVEGAVGLAAAVAYLEGVGMAAVHKHETALGVLAAEKLAAIEGVRVLPSGAARSNGVVSFVVDGVHPHDLSQILDAEEICVRAGHHCAQPLMRSLDLAATTRASFYLYNSVADVERLVAAVGGARKRMGY
ncbi:MAG: SufS family cysteine desulfurase [Gemmatimonadetes bacterium]|nr:SufS family cysteine desulfurase [Gemmatimonadota bacterium]MBI3569208.1 SufS family cysteine desulfurase [Gemmatimonadota bacterium]